MPKDMLGNNSLAIKSEPENLIDVRERLSIARLRIDNCKLKLTNYTTPY